MREINRAVMKKDALALVTGKPVYTEDIAPSDCLVVKALRSPHAHAIVRSVDKSMALKVPGIECILTAEDVPQTRFAIAGQTYPELSPYDHCILDPHIRYVGDPVALIAGADEASVRRAMKLVKVEYEVLEPLLDFRKAKDHTILVHPEEDWKALVDTGGDPKRNLVSAAQEDWGDLKAAMESSEVVVEGVYHTKQAQQAMMETFRAYSYLDEYGRLVLVSSTQVPFHVRRIVATALEIPKSQVRVLKPRIGGGFGAKQTAVMEVYPAIVTKMTGKRAMMIYTREESMTVSSPRHEAEIHVRVGASRDGIIQAISLDALWNAGAYGDHSPTTVTLAGHKAIPLYNRYKAFHFGYEAVYTNTIAAGAYRGYGATQGIFALESAVNELAVKLDMDPTVLRAKNIVHEGEVMPAYFNEMALSCGLDRCLSRVKEMIGWQEKYPRRVLENGRIRAVGLGLAMQGSSISNVDVGSVTLKVNDDGFYTLAIGATDMGTGCDTILAQIAAECLGCSVDEIVTRGVDTDTSPYDSGSYASSTTYLTGMAVVKTCETLKKRMRESAALLLQAENTAELEFDGQEFRDPHTGRKLSRQELGNAAMCNHAIALEATEAHSSPTSPPPFMAGAAEIELDPETGQIELLDFAAVVDCGTVINTALARVQTEGGIVQGIGMTLMEDVVYTPEGRIANNSFMQYRLPSRLDIGDVRVEFQPSYEPNGPFGAKSIGEIVINTPAPAIADAVYHACGVRIKELPITAEKVYCAMQQKNMK